MKKKLLDLCCKAGGAGYGYALAGFDVTGVDIEPQPRYPFRFYQDNALTFPLDGFDAVHVSVPCQAFTKIKALHKDRYYNNLIPAIRERLQRFHGPYVIENVIGSPLENALLLCGTMFDLKVFRHRLFESNMLLFAPGRCQHAGRSVKYGDYVTVVGHSAKKTLASAAMGIEWMTTRELSQAIPPAYTEHIGRQFLAAL